MSRFEMWDENNFRNKITYVSFFLMIAVVSIHTYNIYIYGLDYSAGFVYWFEIYVKFLQQACVPFFFMISGYLFFRNFRMETLIYKYKSRLRTVVAPYFIWCTIYYLVYVCLTGLPYIKEVMNREAVVFSFEKWIDWLWKDQYYTLWFLKDLIKMIILAPVIYFLLYGKGWRKYCGAGVLLIVYLQERGLFFAKYYLFNFYYLIGAYIGINYKSLPCLQDARITKVARVGLVALLMDAYWCVYANKGWGNIRILLFCGFVWYAVDFFKWEKEPKWWMRLSFYCYCIHDLVLEALEKLFLIVFGKSAVCALVDYVCMPFITVFICIISAYVLKKYTPAFFCILTGNRE